MRASERRDRLARLEQLAALQAAAERTRLAQRLRDETRLAQEVAALNARRDAAAARLAQDAGHDIALATSTMGWLRASHDELRRLNIQLAALRARSETAREAASRAAARQGVVEELLRRALKALARKTQG